MAISVNKVILLGIAGQDPDVGSLPGGGEVASFNLMTMEHAKSANGERRDYPQPHYLAAYETNAKIVQAYVKKGAWLYIEGKLTTRWLEDRESGRRQERTEITVMDLVLISGTPKAELAEPSKPRFSEAFKSRLSEAPKPMLTQPPKKAPAGSTNGGNFRGNYGGRSQNGSQGKSPNNRSGYLPNRSGTN
jgi:single-strand DNA-binding protein